ncbi:hypothetical protein E5329_11310 [Petralouisia muris]|uniref:Uncharacterized protein n=1 Tax=Petralouisia muris TaxID=3032872 RepID=A0AC61RWW6_9FIRM|nr:hypothetical protein [Petralouisia muris]TGY96221.1 hypothetical protein E5329_11310 [Petralouisia muris]
MEERKTYCEEESGQSVAGRLKDSSDVKTVVGELEESGIAVDGLTVKEAAKVREIWERFLTAYKESGQEQEEFAWLECQLKKELPEKSQEEARKMKEEIVTSIREYDADLQDMTRQMENGRTKERWFADRMEEAAKGVAVNKYGDYLNQINAAMEKANTQMMRTVRRMDGGIKECINLDGFIAEQHQVNSFNVKATLQKSELYAEIPKQGEAYGKNAFDVVIRKKNEAEKIVHQYQFKFGKDARSTIELFKRGNYNNQRMVVPADQVEEVQRAFPNKSVTAYIGGTDEVGITADPLTKETVKQMQAEAQESGVIPRTDWNVYNTRELAINLGKQAGVAGMQAALLTTGISLAGQVFNGEEIDGNEVVEAALRTGADTGVKAAAGGALTVASEKGVFSILPKPMAPGTITKIACVAVKNVKILWKVAKGDLTMSEGLEHMGRTSTAMVSGLACAGAGAGIGAAALGWIPIVGPIAGGLIGGIVGYTAGSAVGEKVFNGAKKIAEKGGEVVKRAWEGIKELGGSIVDGIRSLFW